MNEFSESSLVQAKQSLEAYRALRAELPRAQEKLTEESYRFQHVEARLEEIESQVRSLESFTMAAILESLRGRRQSKLDELRTELGVQDHQFAEAQSAFNAMHDEVHALETQLAEHQNAEETYRGLCEQKSQALLESGGEPAHELEKRTAEIESARTLLLASKSAADSGRQLFQHLESLARSVRNAKTNRQLAGRAGGVVGAIVKNAVASMAPKSVVRYVVDGLDRFCRDLDKLPLSDEPDDAELMRVRAELEAFRACVGAQGSGITAWDEITTLPALQQVQTALNHLKSWIRTAESTVTALEQQRYEWLERA